MQVLALGLPLAVRARGKEMVPEEVPEMVLEVLPGICQA